MKKILMIIILSCFLFTGCVSSMLEDIPRSEFKRFEYHRGGNVTSTTIIAENSKKTAKTYTVEKVTIKSDYGPFVNFSVYLEGYKRRDL